MQPSGVSRAVPWDLTGDGIFGPAFFMQKHPPIQQPTSAQETSANSYEVEVEGVELQAKDNWGNFGMAPGGTTTQGRSSWAACLRASECPERLAGPLRLRSDEKRLPAVTGDGNIYVHKEFFVVVLA